MNRRQAAALLLFRRRQRRREFWVRELYLRRDTHGEYNILIQELRGDEQLFYSYFRMTTEQFDFLVEELHPYLRKIDTKFRKAITPGERLAVTLRFMATGDSMQTISTAFRMGLTTVSRIIPETSNVIWDNLKDRYLPVPTRTQWCKIQSEFYSLWQFPNCFSAMDGKHVLIQAPNLSGTLFHNYKGTFSIVLLALCDANYRFTLIDVGGYGKQSDGGTFAESTFGQALETQTLDLPEPSCLPNTQVLMPPVMVADEAFPLKVNIMRPYPGRNLNQKKRVFNYRLSRARRVIENTFGILSTKWRMFRRPIIMDPKNVDVVVKACCVLHNFLRTGELMLPPQQRRYVPLRYTDYEDDSWVIQPGEWRNEPPAAGLNNINRFGIGNTPRVAMNVRDNFKLYLSSNDGAVPWQDETVNRGGQLP